MRLICIASDYAKYDVQAAHHIGQNIELMTYRLYGDDLLLLDQIHGVAPAPGETKNGAAQPASKADGHSMTYRLEHAP